MTAQFIQDTELCAHTCPHTHTHTHTHTHYCSKQQVWYKNYSAKNRLF